MKEEHSQERAAGPDDGWPWAYEVRRAARQRANVKERISLPFPFNLAVAAFVYPFLALPILALWKVLSDFSQGNLVTFWDLVGGVIGYPLYAAHVGLFLAIGTPLVAMLIWLAAYYITRSLQMPLDESRLAIQVGGWTALLGTNGIILPFFALSRATPTIALLIVAMAIGPGLAIPLAQYVGTWGQSLGNLVRISGTRRRFGVFQLLVSTTWIALGLGAAKWFGVLSVWVLLYLVGWTAYAWLTMGLVLRFAVRRRKRVLKPGGGNGE